MPNTMGVGIGRSYCFTNMDTLGVAAGFDASRALADCSVIMTYITT